MEVQCVIYASTSAKVPSKNLQIQKSSTMKYEEEENQ